MSQKCCNSVPNVYQHVYSTHVDMCILMWISDAVVVLNLDAMHIVAYCTYSTHDARILSMYNTQTHIIGYVVVVVFSFN